MRYPGYHEKVEESVENERSWRRMGPTEMSPVRSKNMRIFFMTKKYHIMNNPMIMSMG